VQSARPEDNAGLEDFMMMEFFGSNYKSSPWFTFLRLKHVDIVPA
jgi:hypothetical protein